MENDGNKEVEILRKNKKPLKNMTGTEGIRIHRLEEESLNLRIGE